MRQRKRNLNKKDFLQQNSNADIQTLTISPHIKLKEKWYRFEQECFYLGINA